nr:ferrochelatase [Rappaport israeli]
MPKRYFDEGDPYFLHCQETTELVAKALGLAKGAYQMVFQSLFGKEEWLRPYADETIKQMARDGVRSMAVICPGFSADCLETLEEMAIGNRALFLEHGGQVYEYIPALNAQSAHIGLLVDLVKQHAQGWRGFEKVDVYREG